MNVKNNPRFIEVVILDENGICEELIPIPHPDYEFPNIMTIDGVGLEYVYLKRKFKISGIEKDGYPFPLNAVRIKTGHVCYAEILDEESVQLIEKEKFESKGVK